METLLKAHRAQLEILVALKTGLPDFLQQESDVSSSDLAEIFLNSRCRNPSCRSPVPVYECDCKFCSQKNVGLGVMFVSIGAMRIVHCGNLILEMDAVLLDLKGLLRCSSMCCLRSSL
ncbi:unnamed protein product [Prunus armeniaca]|uniref:Uncharacterized protein n=1 Tax=Prunus armeniaca TaxID=36596 RepID=A0A6J5TY43_PRUAR|nr:unnamed protein product [Prunus armeniaca]